MQQDIAPGAELHRARGLAQIHAPVADVAILVAGRVLVDFVLPHPRAIPRAGQSLEVGPGTSTERLLAVLEHEHIRRRRERQADLERRILIRLAHVGPAALRHGLIAPLEDALQNTVRIEWVSQRPVVAQGEVVVLQPVTRIVGRGYVIRVEHDRRAEAIVLPTIGVVERKVAERLVVSDERDLAIRREGTNRDAAIADLIQFIGAQHRDEVWVHRGREDDVLRVDEAIRIRRKTPLLLKQPGVRIAGVVAEPAVGRQAHIVVPVELIHHIHRDKLQVFVDLCDLLRRVEMVREKLGEAVGLRVIRNVHQPIPLVLRVGEVHDSRGRSTSGSAVVQAGVHRLPKVDVIDAKALLGQSRDAGGKAGVDGKTSTVLDHARPYAVHAFNGFEDVSEDVLGLGEVVTEIGGAADDGV